MADEVVTDSGQDGATPSPDTSTDQTDIASDLFGDDAPQDEPTSSANGTSATFDPNAVDIRRTKLEDIPDHHRPYFEPAYKALKDLQAGFTKRDQDLADAQQRASVAEQEWRDRIQQIAAPPPPTQAEQLETTLADDNLTNEQRHGVEVVKQLIAAETQPLMQSLAQMQGIVPTVQHWQQQQEQASQEKLASEISDARGEYGDDIEKYAPQIAALINTSNPQSSSPYTVREAYELVTGKAQSVANEARKTDANVRAVTKSQITSPSGTPIVTHESQGESSTAYARSELEALGFER